MTVTTRPPRTAPSPTRDAPQPPACRPPAPERGAAAALPQRREGPEKLTGAALYTDDLVFPGAWYGATIRSTEPHARLLSVALDPAFDASQVVLVTARDVPGENIVSLISDVF